MATTTIKPIGNHKTELHLPSGAIILYSYETPVAAYMKRNGVLSNYLRTTERFTTPAGRYSVTTPRHITEWLGGAQAEKVSQNVIIAIVNGASAEAVQEMINQEAGDEG